MSPLVSYFFLAPGFDDDVKYFSYGLDFVNFRKYQSLLFLFSLIESRQLPSRLTSNVTSSRCNLTIKQSFSCFQNSQNCLARLKLTDFNNHWNDIEAKTNLIVVRNANCLLRLFCSLCQI